MNTDKSGVQHSNNKKKNHEICDIHYKRDVVRKWLDSAPELHSILAHKLLPNMDEEEARILFAKKYKGRC